MKEACCEENTGAASLWKIGKYKVQTALGVSHVGQLYKYPDVASRVCISRVCFVAAAASGRLVPAVGAVMRPEEVGFTHQAGGKFLSPSGDSR